MSILTDGMIKQGITLENGFSNELIQSVEQKMEKYINEIILFNSAYNLTNTSDHDELIIRHILDSFSAVIPLKSLVPSSNALIADIGSGGGLPGIPLAAIFPEHNFVLVERMAKRCAFLENCAAILGLKNVQVQNLEAEKVQPELSDLTVFRAFRPLDDKMTKTLLALTKTGGYLAAYKAKLSSIKEEMDANKVVKNFEIKKLIVPGLEDSERNLVVIKKD